MNDPAEKFCAACIAGQQDYVHEALQSDPWLANCRGLVRDDHREFMKQNRAEGGWSPLHLAAHYGQLQVVKALIEAGADLNVLSDNGEGNTPLMAAIAGGKIEIVSELLKSGADPLKFDASGDFNALKLAEVDHKPEIAGLIRRFLKS